MADAFSPGNVATTAINAVGGNVSSNLAFDKYIAENPTGRDAWSYLEAILTDYGLGDLSDFAKQSIVEGRSDIETMQRLREQPVYKKRFKVIEDRKSQGLPAMSESEVVDYEKQATALFQSAGLPKGFYDSPDDFSNLMLKDVSVQELQTRIDDGYTAALQAPQEVRDNLERMYGVSTGGLAAYFIDPDRTEAILKQQFSASQRSAAAQQTGYGVLQNAEAERLVGLGVSDDAARQGFGELANQKELFGSLPGENASDISRQQQLSAEFEQNADAKRAIERRGKERVATFQSSNQFAQDQKGTSGLGTAR